MLGLDEIRWYNYACRSCRHREEVEDVVVDAFAATQNCASGTMPTFSCPECESDMMFTGEVFIGEDRKPAPKAR